MKIRTGFVSNSSSSSFCIALKDLTGEQISQIQNHIEVSKELDIDCGFGCNIDNAEWSISIEGKTITGHTDMNDFSMHTFLEEIDVDINKVDWRR